MPPAAGPRSSHQSWALALVAANFVGFTLLLTAVPVVGSARGLSATVVGLTVAVVVGLGVVVDAPAGHAVATWGLRRVVVLGGMLSAAGCLAVAVVPGGATVLAAAPVVAVANALLVNPLLTALAASAGDTEQVPAQLANAGVQRAGALLAAVAVSVLLTWHGGSGLFVVCAAVYLLVATGASRLAPLHGGALPDVLTTYRRSLEVLRTSRQVQLGAVMNVVITTFIVTGGSFVPLLMGATGASSWAVGLVLAAREVVAVVVALRATRRGAALRVVPFVVGAGVVGALALMACRISGATWFLATAFALQGAALCACIAATNLHTVWGTSAGDRLYGFAATSFANRIGGIVVPVVLGAVLARLGAPTAVLTGGVVALLGVLVYAALARSVDAATEPLPR